MGGAAGNHKPGTTGEKFKKLFRCDGCTTTLRVFSFFAALGGFLFGYDLGLISGAIHYIVDDLAECGQADDVVLNVTLAPVLATTSFAFFNDTDGGSGDDGSVHECMSTTAGIIISAAKIGAVVGTFVAGSLMNVGRRTAIGINCGIFVAGPVIMALSETVPVIVVGRFVVGLGVGIGAVVSPAYMSEMSPAVVRGRVVMLYQVFLGIGLLMSVILDYALIDLDENWRYMVGLPAILAVVQFPIIFICPRSPHFLIHKGFDEEARATLAKLYPAGPEAVEAEFQEIKTRLEKLDLVMEKRIKDHGKPCCNRCACFAKWPVFQHKAQLLAVNARELVRGAERAQFSVVILFAFFNQACGSTAIINYAPTIFANVGVEVDEAVILSAALGAIKLLGIIICFFMVDSCGRRPLFVSGFYLMAISLCGLALAEGLVSMPLALVSALACMVAFSFMGAFWVLVGEVFTLGTKVIAAPLCTAMLFGVGAISDLLFSIMIESIGWGTYIVFASFAVMGGLHMHLMLPETKGKKLVDIRRLFKNYTCMMGCRQFMCCCILNKQRVVIGDRNFHSKADVVAAKERGELGEPASDSETDDSDEFADVTSDVPRKAVTTVATVVEEDDYEARSGVSIHVAEDDAAVVVADVAVAESDESDDELAADSAFDDQGYDTVGGDAALGAGVDTGSEDEADI